MPPLYKGIMSKAFVAAAAGLLSLLTACVSEPNHQQRDKTINTALTGACLAARLTPCTIARSDEAQTNAKEVKAASVRASARHEADVASKNAAERSSCLTQDGPRLPVQPSECSTYGGPN
jgi:hypothetical protein